MKRKRMATRKLDRFLPPPDYTGASAMESSHETETLCPGGNVSPEILSALDENGLEPACIGSINTPTGMPCSIPQLVWEGYCYDILHCSSSGTHTDSQWVCSYEEEEDGEVCHALASLKLGPMIIRLTLLEPHCHSSNGSLENQIPKMSCIQSYCTNSEASGVLRAAVRSFSNKGDHDLLMSDISLVRKQYSCDLCTKSFAFERVFEVHKILEHEVHPGWTCGLCGMQFLVKESHDAHIACRHTETVPTTPNSHDSEFEDEQNLQNKYPEVSGENDLDKHSLKKNGVKRCKYYSEKFEEDNIISGKDSSAQESFCNKPQPMAEKDMIGSDNSDLGKDEYLQLSETESLDAHRTSDYQETVHDVNTARQDDFAFGQCSLCFHIFPAKELDEHMLKEHRLVNKGDDILNTHNQHTMNKGSVANKIAFRLDLVDEEDTLQSDKTTLEGNEHNLDLVKFEAESEKTCMDISSDVLGNMKIYNIGQEIVAKRASRVTSKPVFYCMQCPAQFPHASKLRYHMRSHSDERPFKCNQCPNSYKTASRRQNHIRLIHQNIRQHMCDLCGHRFKDKRALSEHSNVHIGYRKYECGVCSRRFVKINHMNVHMRQHTGVKPYVCDQCGQAFTVKVSLRTHLKSKHGVVEHVTAKTPRDPGDKSLPPLGRPKRNQFKKKPSCDDLEDIVE